MNELVDWLVNKCNAFDVRAVIVTIGNEAWQAAFYRQTFEYQLGMDAVTRGQKKAGDTYTEEGIYCVGRLPESYTANKRQGVCYPYGNEDWFIAGYSSPECLNPPYREFHPFGLNFILRPWNVPNTKIDDYRKPYLRIPMTIQDVA